MQVGVCSWSLRPDSPEALAESVKACGLTAVQLALDPIREGAWNAEHTTDVLTQAGIIILSGMMAAEGEDYTTLETISRTGGLRPDSTWETNLAAAEANADIARALGLKLVTFHVGFIPDDPADSERRVLIERCRRIADEFAARGCRLGFETGQESAITLCGILEQMDHPHIGVNFDPANMILYGKGDPIEALDLLSEWVVQVHLKDAIATTTPGTWGTEVPAGEGQVDWEAFFTRVSRLGVDVLIEREAGENRVKDVVQARQLARQHMET